jgi:hypothetical protein
MAAQGAEQELTQLLWVFSGMASKLRIHGPLTEFFVCLYSAPHLLLQNAISSLQAAVGVFSQQSSGTWHEIYIQARLCDCLYHGRVHNEIVSRRTELLHKQQALYGPLARTVIWTMTNIANDLLNAGNIDRGETYASIALMQAEKLTDFGRPEMRFAALQCLALAELMRFEQLCRGSCESDVAQRGVLILQNGHRHLDEALQEANIWFDRSSYRVAWAREERKRIQHLLAGLGHRPLDHDFFPEVDLDNNS